MNKIRIGLIGCGNICPNYLRYARHFTILDVLACADLVLERAKLSLPSSMCLAHVWSSTY